MAQDQMRAKHIYGDSLSLLTLLQQLCQLPTLNATVGSHNLFIYYFNDVDNRLFYRKHFNKSPT